MCSGFCSTSWPTTRADVFGALGVFAATIVTDRKGLAQALDDALGRDAPACLNVLVSCDDMPPEEAVIVGQDPFAE